MTSQDEALGRTLARLRATAKRDRNETLREALTQAELAEAMEQRGHKWSQSTVWSVEKGTRPLRFSEVLDICDILQESVLEFTHTRSKAALSGLAVLQLRERASALSALNWALDQIAKRCREIDNDVNAWIDADDENFTVGDRRELRDGIEDLFSEPNPMDRVIRGFDEWVTLFNIENHSSKRNRANFSAIEEFSKSVNRTHDSLTRGGVYGEGRK